MEPDDVDTGERLAAYLSGDLDPDEVTALEADLAGDPTLRAHLDRIRAADEALAGVGEVVLPDGFAERLRTAVEPELDAVLGDELAARRARRAMPRWAPALAGAAALAAIVGGGIAIVGPSGEDQPAEMADMDAGADTTAEADDAELFNAGEADEAVAAGPLVVNRGRTLRPEDLAELAQDPMVRGRLGDHEDAPAQLLSEEFRFRLEAEAAAPEPTAGSEDAATDQGEAAGGATESPHSTAGTARASVRLDFRGAVSQQDLDDVVRCLPEVMDSTDNPLVPLYAELGVDEDGSAVIAIAALGPNADGNYERIEVWLLDRDSCRIRNFVQRSR